LLIIYLKYFFEDKYQLVHQIIINHNNLRVNNWRDILNIYKSENVEDIFCKIITKIIKLNKNEIIE